MKITKEQKGITLLALIITIIVLLILAGVALATLTGNTSIIDNANNTVEKYNSSANADQEVLNQVESLFAKYMVGEQAGDNTGDDNDDDTPQVQNYTITYYPNGGTGTMGTETENGFILEATTIAENGFTSPLNNGFVEWNTKADGTGTGYIPGDNVSSNLNLYAIWGGTYRLGEEVTINVIKGTETVSESFYVIEDEGVSATKVTLLSKYNLDKNLDETTGKYYQKPNASNSDTACTFSSTAYWKNEWKPAETGKERRFDLNNEEKYGTAELGSALARAKIYAIDTLNLNPNATGRLLTYEEFMTLRENYENITSGRENKQGENSSSKWLSYWLSSIGESIELSFMGDDTSEYVWNVDGTANIMDNYVYNTTYGGGVRPVVTVEKSLIN